MGGQRRLDVRAPEDHGIQARLRPLLLLVGRKRACTCPRGRERLTTPHHLTKSQLQYNDECLRAPTLEIHAEPTPGADPNWKAVTRSGPAPLNCPASNLRARVFGAVQQ